MERPGGDPMRPVLDDAPDLNAVLQRLGERMSAAK
jgi:hypothetical protein